LALIGETPHKDIHQIKTLRKGAYRPNRDKETIPKGLSDRIRDKWNDGEPPLIEREKMEDKEQDEIIKHELSLINESYALRGAFIDAITIIEHDITELIAAHYCGKGIDKRREFINVIGHNQSFFLGFKFTVFTYILKNHFEDIYKSDASLLSDIESLITTRNHFAHKATDNSVDDGIAFLKFSTKDSKIADDKSIHVPMELLLRQLSRMIEISEAIKTMRENSLYGDV